MAWPEDDAGLPDALTSFTQTVHVETGFGYGVMFADLHVSRDRGPVYVLVEHQAASAPEAASDRSLEQPSRLLDARAKVVAFTGREQELTKLTRWRDTRGSRLSARWLHGPGGSGKTRLAEEFAEACAAAGWKVVTALYGPGAALPQLPSQNLRTDKAAGLLVVVDYADRWPLSHLTLLLSNALLHRDVPTRLLLVARSAYPWPAVQAVQRHGDRARLVLTSRNQVLTEARQSPSELLGAIIDHATIVEIGAARIGPVQRREILLNHFHFSELARPALDRIAFDPLLNSLVHHKSFSPRILQMATEGLGAETSAEEALIAVREAFDDPTALWDKTFTALEKAAQEIVLTLASFPEGPTAFAGLKDCAPPLQARDRREAMNSLTPSWVREGGSAESPWVAFANPGCRDYLYSKLDDTDVAEEFIHERVKTHEQLLNLSNAAGALEVAVLRRRARPRLAAALIAQRDVLAAQLEVWWNAWRAETERSTRNVLVRLRQATTLFGVFCSADAAGWLIRAFEGLLEVPPGEDFRCADGVAAARALAAAAQSLQLGCSGLVTDVLVAAIDRAGTTMDLITCEFIPEDLIDARVSESLQRRATAITCDELERAVLDDLQLEEREEILDELESLSTRYDLDLDLDELRDIIDAARQDPDDPACRRRRAR